MRGQAMEGGYKISAARNFLILAAIRNFVMGSLMVFWPEKFTSTSFKSLFTLAPCTFWGFAMLASGSVLVLAILLRDTLRARIGLVVSAAVLVAIGTSATAAILLDGQEPGGLFAIIIFFILAGKDLLLVSTSFVRLDQGYAQAEREAWDEGQEDRDNGSS